ncbi:MAG: ABC transporter ATP-binding protein, partial [Selenomonadales bacterium]|nr:ABC transporter ATP-binding protein [Selenomonadales bacterium]
MDKTKDRPSFDVQNAGRLLLRFARPSAVLFVVAGILMLSATALELLRPYLLKVAIDDSIALQDMEGLYRVIALYLGSLIASGIVIYAQTMILQHVGQKIIHQMRELVLKRILSQSYDSLQKQSVGAMLTNVTNDTEAVKELYTGVLVASLCDVLIVIGIMIAMLIMDWQLALIVILMMPILIWGMKQYKELSRAVYRTIREKNAQVNIYLQESLHSIGIVKAFARLKQNEEEFNAV